MGREPEREEPPDFAVGGRTGLVLLRNMLEDFLMRLGRRAELAVGLDGAELEVVVTSVEVKQLLTGANSAPFLFSGLARSTAKTRVQCIRL